MRRFRVIRGHRKGEIGKAIGGEWGPDYSRYTLEFPDGEAFVYSLTELLETDRSWAIGQLRHLYGQMVNGQVKNTKAAAEGILGPALSILEEQ